jgi:hypothetical protein
VTLIESEAYFDHLRSVVDEFLETVVVVDDRAFSHGERDVPGESTDEAPLAPGGRGVTQLMVVPVAERDQLDDEHDLNPKAVTDAFAEAGFVCALLAPKPGEDIDGKLLTTARRADLLVLDWVLEAGDDGAKARELLRRVLKQDRSPECERLRVVAIYTGQHYLREVADRLAETIDEVWSEGELERHDDGLAVTKGPIRGAVFAKENVRDLPSDLASRRVAFSDLPIRLRDEFAALAKGLLTTVAIAALAALREDSHRILRRLGPSLDEAYLGHRVALPSPDDACDHAVSLVIAEVRSVVEDHDIGSHVVASRLRSWTDDPARADRRFGDLLDGKRLSKEQLSALITSGVGDTDAAETVRTTPGAQLSKGHMTKIKNQASLVFAETSASAAESNASFANRMAVRTVYGRGSRILQLGALLRWRNDEYLLCVQPACDSVRITTPQAFPFLALSVVDPSAKPRIVLPGVDGAWVYLELDTHPRELVMLTFTPNDLQRVEARASRNGHWLTTSAGRRKRYQWVGELKPQLAQHIVVDLGSKFARVAVDEAEPLRLRL